VPGEKEITGKNSLMDKDFSGKFFFCLTVNRWLMAMMEMTRAC
jgi:hypothetical protein